MGIFSAGSASVNIVPDFSGAQRAIARWAEGRDVPVKINPDLDKSRMAVVDAEIARPRKMHVNIDVDRKQLLEFADFLTGFSTVGKTLKGLFSPKVLGLTDAGGAAVAMAGALSQAAGAALLLPAGIAAAAAPMAVLAIGVQGIGQTFKDLASGNMAKVNKDMANLAPSARDFVTQMHALGPAFKDLRLDVQQQLFQGLGTDISNLAKSWLPILHTGLGDVAVGLNAMATQATRALTSTAALAGTKEIFANLNLTFGALSGSVRPFIEAFGQIARVGSSFLPGLAQGITGVATAMNKWVQGAAQSGQLAEIIHTAFDRIAQVFRIIMDAGRLIYTIMKPAIDAGATLLDTFDKLLVGITRVLQAPVAQSSLRVFFDSVSKAVGILVPAVTDLVSALVTGFLPVAGKLAEALAPIAGTLLHQFADLLRQIAPIIYPTLVNAIAAWFKAIGPLIPVFGEIAQALLPTLAKVLGQIAPLIGQVASMFGAFLAKALIQLTPLVGQIGAAFVQILKALLPILPPIFTLIQTLLPPLIKLFQAIIPVVVQIVQAIAPLIVQLAQVLTPIIKVLADIIVWAFQHVILPVILWVIKSVVVPLIQTFIDIIKALWTAIKWAWENVIQPVWHAIETAANWLWHNVLNPVFTAIRDAWNWLATEFGRIYHGFIEPIWKFITDAIGTVKHGFEVAVQGISDIWHGLIHALEYPVQLAIDFVWNNTLRKAWNLLNDLWHGTDLQPVVLPGMDAAEGAVLPGYTPGRDVHHFVSPTAGMLNLSGGEAIMVPEFTQAVGEAQIYAWNKLARTHGPAGVRQALGFAGGGVWPTSGFGSDVGLGDRSLNWVQQMGADLSVVVPFLPGGQLLAPLIDYVKNEATGSKDQGGTPIFGMIGATIRNALNMLWGTVKSFVMQTLMPGGGAYADYHAAEAARAAAAANAIGGNPILGASTSSSANVITVHNVANGFGWGSDPEWSALSAVIMRESGFRNTAANPTSTAYGMFQFLDSTWRSFGPKTSDPLLQAKYGLEYISERYGDPLGALRHEQAFGWYDRGGWLPPGYSMAYNGTGRPEAILDAGASDRLSYVLSGASGGAVAGNSLIGQVHIHAMEDRAADIMSELWFEVRRQSRGGVYTMPTIMTGG